MAQEIAVDKKKFDTLLTKMLASPPLPLADLKADKMKSKKRQRVKAK